ncbi:MAG: response regulator [Acetobacteraceae bacterium]
MQAGLRGAIFAVLTVVMAGLLARHLVQTGQSVAGLARAGLETSATAAARATDAALDRFADRAGRITAADLRGDRLALTARLLHMQIALPGMREVFAATPSGTLIAASDPLPRTAPDLSARGWFQRAIAAPAAGVGLALTTPGWSRHGSMTILTYPVRNAAGAVTGVVGALADPDWGARLLARAPLSRGERLRLLTPTGTVLAAAVSGRGTTGAGDWRSVPAELLAHFALRAVPARLKVTAPLQGAAAGLHAEMSRSTAWAVYWPLLRGGVAGAGLEFLALWAVFGVLLLRRPGSAAPPAQPRPQPQPIAVPVAAPPTSATQDRAEAAETALAEARRALAATKREQETALAAIGHDMRTPMQSVLGICDLLLDGALEDEPRRWVEQLRASATALLALLNGLLAIAGGSGPAIEAADIAELLQGAAALFAAEAAQRGIMLTLEIDPALGGDWSVDAARLRQIVVNLLANAVSRTIEGSVTLAATPEPDGMGLRISVTDTGPGIAPADHDRIFLPHERADDRVPGLGLGLALCRDAALAMGGRLAVDSSLGQGARFTLTCPAERLPDDVRRHAFAGRAALIVGLPEAQRGALAVRLEALGFAVESAPDGYLGLALAERAVARSGVLDVVVLDLALCGMAPEAFCLRLRGSGFGQAVALVGLVEDGAIRPDGLDAALRRGASAGEVANQVARLLADQPALSALLPAGTAGTASGGRVLVVEDDATNRALIGAALARHGFTAFPATSGEDALRMAEHDGLDAVLLDLMLPGIDGIETARRIRALPGRASVIPLIALTARAGEATEAECRAAGITAVLGKPTDLDQLAQRLRGWIASTPRGAALPPGMTPAAGASPVAQVSEPFLEAMVAEIGLERTRACVQEFLDEAAGKTLRLAELVAGGETAAVLRICEDLKGLADLFGAVGFSEMIEELGVATDHAATAEATRLMGVLEAGMPPLPDAMWAALGAIERRRAERGRRAA